MKVAILGHCAKYAHLLGIAKTLIGVELGQLMPCAKYVFICSPVFWPCFILGIANIFPNISENQSNYQLFLLYSIKHNGLSMANSINKTTLARMYGWTLKYLAYKINTSKNLLSELKQSTEYNPYQRLFTPLQIEIIFKHFGTPESDD